MSQKTTTSVSLKKPGPEELKLIEDSVSASEQALSTFLQASSNVGAAFDASLGGALGASESELQSGLQDQALRGISQQDDLDAQIQRALEGEGLSSGESQILDDLDRDLISRGNSDIDRNTRDALELVREELAPSRGLRAEDSSIQDRGFRIAEEAMREKNQFARDVRINRSQTNLNRPLDLAGVAGQQSDRLSNRSGLAGELAARAQQNRLSLLGTTGNAAFGGSNLPLATLQAIRAPRLAQTKTKTSSFGPAEIQGIAGAGGAVVGGIAQAVAAV